jgi:hypothetical protein
MITPLLWGCPSLRTATVQRPSVCTSCPSEVANGWLSCSRLRNGSRGVSGDAMSFSHRTELVVEHVCNGVMHDNWKWSVSMERTNPGGTRTKRSSAPRPEPNQSKHLPETARRTRPPNAKCGECEIALQHKCSWHSRSHISGRQGLLETWRGGDGLYLHRTRADTLTLWPNSTPSAG